MASSHEQVMNQSSEPIKVSILCNAYNHERYIAKALEGFVMQKTDFAFEICIHDDASTDDTANIIKRYEQRYPQLFKCIYQNENQYSKGVGIMVTNLKRAKGNYIAVCEGDDVWTDPHKLQRQADYLDKHPDCSLVGHASMMQNARFPFIRKAWRISDHEKTISMDEIILNKGILFPHNAIMYRKKDVEWPSFFGKLGVADAARTIQSGLMGEVHYFSDVMSIYRVGVRHSWTERVRLNRVLISEHYQREVDFYTQLNEYTGHRYQESIDQVIRKLELLIKIKQRRFDALMEEPFSSILGKQGLRFKLSLVTEHYFPHLYTQLQFLRFWLWV